MAEPGSQLPPSAGVSPAKVEGRQMKRVPQFHLADVSIV